MGHGRLHPFAIKLVGLRTKTRFGDCLWINAVQLMPDERVEVCAEMEVVESRTKEPESWAEAKVIRGSIGPFF